MAVIDSNAGAASALISPVSSRLFQELRLKSVLFASRPGVNLDVGRVDCESTAGIPAVLGFSSVGQLSLKGAAPGTLIPVAVKLSAINMVQVINSVFFIWALLISFFFTSA